MGGARIIATVLVSLVLAAFSPPQSKREPAQQEPQKSWIPERKSETEPPIAVPIDPPGATSPPGGVEDKLPSQLTHPTGVSCFGQQSSAPTKVARAFVEAYSQAKLAVSEKRFQDALALAEKAASHAQDARQWMAIEGIRIVALGALGDDANLIATLESAIALNCASPDQAIQHEELLDGARKRLESRSER